MNAPADMDLVAIAADRLVTVTSIAVVHGGGTAKDLAQASSVCGSGGPDYSWMADAKGIRFTEPRNAVVPWKAVHAVLVDGLTDDLAAEASRRHRIYCTIVGPGRPETWNWQRDRVHAARLACHQRAYSRVTRAMRTTERRVADRGLAALSAPSTGQLDLFGALEAAA